MRWRLCDTDWNHWPAGIGDDETWAAVASGGFAGIELGVYRAADELAPARLARLDELSRRHQLPIAMLLLSLPRVRWPDGALSAQAGAVAAEVGAIATVASGLGLDTIGVWPGADLPGADVRAGLAEVAVAAAPVRIAVEYKPGTAVGCANEAIALARAVPGTGVLLDTGHAFAAGEDPAAVVRTLGDLLWHVHLGDADVGDPEADLPLGRRHDFADLLAALGDTGYAGAASLDLYGSVVSGALTGVDAGRESRAHLLAGQSAATR